MSRFNDILLGLLIPGLISLHLWISPFTKVEESFNVQAVHDITSYGIPFFRNGSHIVEHYDHVDFPGAVPRTFVGALLLALVSSPVLPLIESPKASQILVRGLLGALNATALLEFRRTLRRKFGRSVANWFVILQASQFHLMYYASRTLPNMFAFALTIFAYKFYVLALASPSNAVIARRRHGLSLFVLTIAGVVFRSELAVLVFAQTAYLLATQRASISKTVIPAGISGLLVGLLITVPIDSFFWQKYPVWPEWTAFYYNTILGQSSNWGTSPWYFYFVDSLPRLLLNPLVLLMFSPIAIVAPATRQRATDLLIPASIYVSILSYLPHKEWRFIVYIIPAITAVGAMGASWIWNRRTKTILYRAVNLVLLGSIAASFAGSFLLLAISRMNYPGGDAIIKLQSMTTNTSQPFKIYVDNLACQTGVTRFLESRKVKFDGQLKWSFDKTENETTLLEPLFWHQFDYAVMEHGERAIGKWETVATVNGLDGLKLIRPGADVESTGNAVDDFLIGERHDVFHAWDQLGDILRDKATKGWWFTVGIRPKLKILKRQV